MMTIVKGEEEVFKVKLIDFGFAVFNQ